MHVWPACGGWDLHMATVLACSFSEKKLRSTCVCSDIFILSPFEHTKMFGLKCPSSYTHQPYMFKAGCGQEEMKLAWFNVSLVIRPIVIIDHADDWSLPHLQNKTCLHKLLSGFKISLCQQMLYSSTACSAVHCAALTISCFFASIEASTLTQWEDVNPELSRDTVGTNFFFEGSMKDARRAKGGGRWGWGKELHMVECGASLGKLETNACSRERKKLRRGGNAQRSVLLAAKIPTAMNTLSLFQMPDLHSLSQTCNSHQVQRALV